MRDLPELLILRHGETAWNRAGRLQGRFDSPLTEAGRAQAAAQNRLLHEAGAFGRAWHVSPQRRARETARIAAKGLAPVMHSDPRLAEIGLGDWAGRPRAELAAAHPALFAPEASPLGWYDHAPGGEGLAALAERLTDFLEGLRAPSVVVTHGITSRVLRCLALGRPMADFGDMPGGQGVIYRVAEGRQERLAPAP